MDPSKNKRIHGLLNQLGWMEQKMNLVRSFTNDRTASSSEMTNIEANKLMDHLQKEVDRMLRPMRNKVIHYMCLIGYTIGENPDLKRIDVFIKNIGSRNPNKKGLYRLSKAELRDVLNQVEQRFKKELNR